MFQAKRAKKITIGQDGIYLLRLALESFEVITEGFNRQVNKFPSMQSSIRARKIIPKLNKAIIEIRTIIKRLERNLNF